MKLPIVGPTYKLEGRSYDAQRCVNLEPIMSEVGTSKSPSYLRATPGKSLFSTIGSGPGRGGLTASNGRCFAASGNKLYEIDDVGNETELGTLNSFTSRVCMAENGQQLLIVDGVNGYIFTYATNTFLQISDTDFPNGATFCAYLDTYFIVNVPNTQFYAISNNNDGTDWDALDRAAASASPDDLTTLLTDHGEVWMGGPRGVEVHYNTGNPAFPFERIPNAIITMGVAAPHTFQRFDNSVVWLGKDENGRGVVMRSNGYQSAVKISTRAIDEMIAKAVDESASYAYVYHQKGIAYYVLQVSGLNTTLVYSSQGFWHERMYFDNTLNAEMQDLGAWHATVGRFNLVGDRTTGKVYKLDPDVYTDNGDAIHRIRIVPHLTEELNQIRVDEIRLDVETGVGLTSGQGSDPLIMMQVSRDGGRTYGNERTTSIGKKGQYGLVPRFNRLGMGRDLVFLFRYSEPTFFQINGAYIKAQLGAH